MTGKEINFFLDYPNSEPFSRKICEMLHIFLVANFNIKLQ